MGFGSLGLGFFGGGVAGGILVARTSGVSAKTGAR